MIGIVPLTFEDVRMLNEIVIAQTSEPEEHDIVAILNKNNISNCCDALTNYFYGKEQYQGLFSKAAELLDCIVRAHGFASANKRTSIAALNLFLHRNGWIYRPDHKLKEITLRILRAEISMSELETWIRTCCTPKNL